MADSDGEIVRPVLSVLVVIALIVTSFWILRPFIGAFIWASTIVVATWPILLGLQRRLRGRRGLAVTILSLILIGVLFVPFVISVGAIVANVDSIVAAAQSASTFQVPPLPKWVAELPLVGERLSLAWEKVVGSELKELFVKLAPYAGQATRWTIARIGGVGLIALQFLLTVVIAAILWSKGEQAAAMAHRHARRLAGDRGEAVLRLVGQAIRGVALGVVVTALAQSLAGGLGLLIADVPFVPLLTAVMFILSIAQVGPFLVLVPCVIWVFSTGRIGFGIFLLVWTLVVGTFDNFLRPILIRRGADLPLLLVFAGVLGGLFAFGLIGIFVGPVVLAVTYTLAENWADQPTPPAPAPEQGPG